MAFSVHPFSEIPFSSFDESISTSQLLLLKSNSTLIDSIHLDGVPASQLFYSGSVSPQFWFGLSDSLFFSKDSEYTLSFQTVGVKANNTFEGKMEVYLVGSPFKDTNQWGFRVATLVNEVGSFNKYFDSVQQNFIAQTNGTAFLRFVVYGGQWFVNKVSLEFASERGFNPDGTTGVIPIEGRRFEQLQFSIELLDINNNSFPIPIQSKNVLFDGGTFQIRGNNNRIDGSLIIAASGSGPTLVSTEGGSFIGISSGSVPRPISPSALDTYTGSAIVTIFSGSDPFDTSGVGEAVGIQIIGTSGSQVSFLDFNTLTQTLRIRGDIDVIPNSPIDISMSLSLNQIQDLVNGSGSNLPIGTFISGKSIISPIIAGNAGFFSTKFGVGDISNNNGIVLTAEGFTGSLGVITPNAPAIYIGTDKFADSSAPFFVASGSNGTLFSLGDKFTWDNQDLFLRGLNLTLTSQASGTLMLGNAVSLTSGSGVFASGQAGGEFRVGDGLELSFPSFLAYSGGVISLQGDLFVRESGSIGDFSDVRQVMANFIAFGPFGFYVSNL